MTMIDPLHPLQSYIIEIIAEHPKITIDEVYEILKQKKECTASLPNVYRTIRLMNDAHILVKEGHKISLNHIWIPHILALGKTIVQKYYNKTYIFEPLQENERKAYKADCLAGLDSLWFHCLMEYGQTDVKRTWYAYNAHPWHVLATPETELRGYEAMNQRGITTYMLYGNDSFLDHYGVSFIQVPNFYTHINTQSIFPKKEYLLWVNDEYIIDCIIPSSLAERLSYFFETTHSIQQWNVQQFIDIFSMKMPCSLIIRRNKKEAKKLKNTIQKYFTKQ